MNNLENSYRPRAAWTIAGLLAVMMLVNFLDKVVIGLVAVPMMKDLELTPTEFGLIGGSLHWLFAISAVAGGFLANRKPTRTLLLGIGLFWALVQLPMLFVSSLWAIVACRVLLGIGEGPASPVATHALYKWFPDDRRSLPVALLHSGSAMGLLVAGIMIPWVSLHYGWRANFAVLAVVGLVWCLLWLKFGREGGLDRLVGKAPAGPGSAPMPYRRLLRDGTVLGNYLCHFAANWSLALTLTWVPAYLETGLGIDSLNTGRLFGLFVLVTTPLSLFMAWWSQRLLRRGVPSSLSRGVFVSVCLIASGLLSMALILPDLSVPLRIACWVVEATLKPGKRHIYSKRRYFIDEDTWAIVEADHYDSRGELWRVGESHGYFHPGVQAQLTAMEVFYDLQSGRYIASGMTNEQSEPYDFDYQATASDYSPGALRSAGLR
ncbi:MFS transporter [Stutzerimonas urumqiensis]|uniref:MFS transporter n=1 Tax=Stutzerimonas urumqiensis TaxID=638269 RepID=UPI000EB251AF|nr:MFS transporter [Stutzerimonas urumqiensis]